MCTASAQSVGRNAATFRRYANMDDTPIETACDNGLTDTSDAALELVDFFCVFFCEVVVFSGSGG